MPESASFSFHYMKYITLLLLVLVFLYGIHHDIVPSTATTTISLFHKELPIYCVDTDKPVVALTFDSAWGTEDLNEILAILQKHNASATFFVTGEWADKNPDAIRAIPQLSKEEMAKEIQDCHNAVYNITGKDMTLFRAPYSDWNDQVVEVAHALGYAAINQSVDSLDWKDYGVDAIIRTVCEHKNLENGSIILLHNGSKYTKDAIDIMLTNLEHQGYSFIPLSELIYISDYELDHTGKQFQK